MIEFIDDELIETAMRCMERSGRRKAVRLTARLTGVAAAAVVLCFGAFQINKFFRTHDIWQTAVPETTANQPAAGGAVPFPATTSAYPAATRSEEVTSGPELSETAESAVTTTEIKIIDPDEYGADEMISEEEFRKVLSEKGADAIELYRRIFFGWGWEYDYDEMYTLNGESSVVYYKAYDNSNFTGIEEVRENVSRCFTQDIVEKYMENIAEGRISDGILVCTDISKFNNIIITDDGLFIRVSPKDGFMPPDLVNAWIESRGAGSTVFRADVELDEDEKSYFGTEGPLMFRGKLVNENGEWKFASERVAERIYNGFTRDGEYMFFEF